MTTTPLGKIQSNKKPPIATKETSKLGGFLALMSRGETVELPLLGPVFIMLASHDELNEVEGETWAEMQRLALELTNFTALTYEADKAMRVLARCVRDPGDHSKPFGTVEEWSNMDSDLLAACNFTYLDVRARLDPLAGPAGWGNLSDADRLSIKSAIEKKNAIQLLNYGSATLANYMLTSDAPRASFPIPSSEHGDSLPES